MADDTGGVSGGGGSGGEPPAFPGSAPPPPMPPPAMPPPPPAPPQAPPAYPGGYQETSGQSQPGQFPPPGSFDTPTGIPYAQWGTRIGGYLIDFVIFIPVLVIMFVIFRNTHALQVHLMMRNNRHGTPRHFSFLSVLVTGVLYIAYSTILCGGPRGQTVGMMAVGVRAVRDGTSGALGYGRAFWRALMEQLFRLVATATLILAVIWLLDMLWPLWDPKRQTLHDKATGTVVLRTKNTG